MDKIRVKPTPEPDRAKAGGRAELPKPLVLIGLMGSGKSKVGRMLASQFGLEFADSDDAIVDSAGMDITGIFEAYGEPAFRDLETRVLARMLKGPVRVIATGGGAFMDGGTRSLVKSRAISLWLKADPPTLARRISHPERRPLLKGRDPASVLETLAVERHPVYAEADLTVETDGLELDGAVAKAERELAAFLKQRGTGASP